MHKTEYTQPTYFMWFAKINSFQILKKIARANKH